MAGFGVCADICDGEHGFCEVKSMAIVLRLLVLAELLVFFSKTCYNILSWFVITFFLLTG